MTACKTCNDTGWVCENHRDTPWENHYDCGAGAPCRVCNAPTNDPEKVPGTTRIGLKPTIDRKHRPRH